MVFAISTKGWGTTPAFHKMAPPNLYKMVRHNPCITKNSPYKMALVEMNPSKNDSLYKMVVANPIFSDPKINKMFGV